MSILTAVQKITENLGVTGKANNLTDHGRGQIYLLTFPVLSL